MDNKKGGFQVIINRVKMSDVSGIRESGSNFGPVKCQMIQPWKAQLAGLIVHLMGHFEVKALD